MITYKPLGTEFIKSGFRFRQLFRENDVAVFHKVGMKGLKHPVNFDAGFETVKISRHDAYERDGNIIEAGEAMPSPEQWGASGWSYSNLFAAESKFEELLGRKTINVNNPAINDTDETVSSEEAVREPGQRGRAKGPRPVLNLPETEFTVKELAEFNKVEYPVAFLFIKEALEKTEIKFLRTERRNVKGKESSIYAKV